MRDSRDWHENEVLTIDRVEVINSLSVVHLTTPVQFNHIARQEYQGEVGLLTRTIKVQGAETDSVPTEINQDACTLTRQDNNKETTAFGHKEIICPNEYLDGYGGHIMIHDNAKGRVEGVELNRMGQTNVLGRYPIHFHLLGDTCTDCYFKDSSVHESYYRCISIHATNGLLVSENVGYDITGYCYYLEDGVEEDNTLSYNLAAHVHFIGSPAIGGAQRIPYFEATPDLTLPADVTASGFYITNLQNTVKGNVASGGWAGFAFPNLHVPNGPSAANFPGYDPRRMPTKEIGMGIDGNTAHSTAHFWNSAAAFYFGGALFIQDGILKYNAGRDARNEERRKPCKDEDFDEAKGKCLKTYWNQITNSKVYQVGNVGLGSWSGEIEILGFECHDCGLTMEALVQGFWADDVAAVCRTGENLVMPGKATSVRGDGFRWYDTGQEHIFSNSEFRNCGYRSDEFNQYDTSPDRGCGDSLDNGCHRFSSVWTALSHSDQFNPEVMQATKAITMNKVGRRFKMSNLNWETVSGNIQNWDDVDGSVSGLKVPTIIGSGFESIGPGFAKTTVDDTWKWWNVGKLICDCSTMSFIENFSLRHDTHIVLVLMIDSNVVADEQAPFYFIPKGDGAARGVGHMHLTWDEDLHNTGGKSVCFNGGTDNCPHLGTIRHLGGLFSSEPGLPVTATPDIAGLAGGYGWLLNLDAGAPKYLKIDGIEVDPSTPMTLSIAYPVGTTFTITATAGLCSWRDGECTETFTEVTNAEEVRNSAGNVYHFDETTGVLTVRIVMFYMRYTGQPNWILPTFDTPGLTSKNEPFALKRFERDGVRLPIRQDRAFIEINADCTSTGGIYCDASPPTPVVATYDNVCSPGYEQVSYDQCCLIGQDPFVKANCEYAIDHNIFAPIV